MNSYYPTYRKATVSSGYDSDAQAFITASGITDTTQKDAINALVVGLKADSLWTLMKAIYPFVGGTAATHKWNLKNPLDTDAAFRIIWNGTFTHNSNGINPSGTNSYGNTYINPSTAVGVDSYHLSVYNRTSASNTNTYETDFACGEGFNESSITINAAYRLSTHNASSDAGSYDQNRIEASGTNKLGLFTTSRTGSTTHTLYRNSTSIGTNSTTRKYSLPPNANLFLCDGNYLGAVGQRSVKNLAFATFGDGLSAAQVSNLYSRIQTYQTSLGRNV